MSKTNNSKEYLKARLIRNMDSWLPIIQCQVPGCGAWLGVLTHVHVAKHGLTQEEYCKEYPQHCDAIFWGDAPLSPNRKKFKEYMKGGDTK